jgi:Flp pilus assembly pilin Flp
MRRWVVEERDWVNDQKGQDIIEYTLLVALITTVSTFSLMLLGVNVGGLWQTLAGWFAGVPASLPIP